uniref:acetate--CoA ligase n=1 Tax=Bionectria ochroleuca TaxID=29856 RepID=A0A8H7TQK4_BIOOC
MSILTNGSGPAPADAFDVPAGLLNTHPSKPHLEGDDLSAFENYKRLHEQSIKNPSEFWGSLARDLLTWSKDFDIVRRGSLERGDLSWFLGGELNACYNCVALIYEADEPEHGRVLTYDDLLREVCQLAYVLKDMGVKKGDTVAIYMPMVPEAIIALLACVRIGAVHSVIFAGFSSDSLRDRINDAKCKVVLTSNESKRGGKTHAIKHIVDKALVECPAVTSVLVFRRTESEVQWIPGRDHWWQDAVKKWPAYIAPERMNAEDPLSCSTRRGLRASQRVFCTALAAICFFCGGDIGWITGHTYVVYAPLLLGVSTIVFEGSPMYPNPSRYWDIIDKHNVTHFYVAPTALRLLKKSGDQHVTGDRAYLRVLGSVGEPIAPEVWKWYFEVVGKGQAQIVDTYWQTETGSHVIAPLAGATPTKPGAASFPFFGIEPAILDAATGEEIDGANVEGVLAFKQAWPSMARTVWGAHDRYMDTYLRPFKGYYYTGDGASRDKDGFYWIGGRMDDIINVSGHRISTAEIEAALIEDFTVAEAAVVAVQDEITGQASVAFLTLKDHRAVTPEIRDELILQVRRTIGPFAAPRRIYVVDDLPKTRSGKIMRRVLRKILAGEQDQLGDTSTLSDPTVVERIIAAVQAGPI